MNRIIFKPAAVLMLLVLFAFNIYVNVMAEEVVIDGNAYTLTEVESPSGKNIITRSTYNQETRAIDTKYYRLDLKKTEYGTGDTSVTVPVAAPKDNVDVTVKYDSSSLNTRVNNTTNNSSKNTTGDFANLTSTSDGAAVYNYGSSAKLGNFNSNFINNSITTTSNMYGGAIYNSNYTGSTINSITGNFIGNYTKNTSSSNYSIYGGAISNRGVITTITGDFVGNYLEKTANYGSVYGGAIYNGRTITNLNSNFVGNGVIVNNYGYGYGGAIYNGSTISNLTGDFIGNYVKSNSSYNYNLSGGAIYNTSSMTINNSSFIGNYVYSMRNTSSYAIGGAIYNNGTLTLNAKDGYTSLFSGNYVQYGSTKKNEAIYINSGTVNFNATNGGKFVFDDYISGSSGTLNIKGDSTGVVEFHGGNNYTGTTNIESVTIDMVDGAAKDHKFGKLTSNANARYRVDVICSTGIADTITVTSGASGTITLDTINFVGDDVYDKKFQILKSVAGNNIVLAFADDIKLYGIESTLSPISLDVGNSVDFGDTVTSGAGVLLVTKDTYNDSILVTKDGYTETQLLELLNQKPTAGETRKFNFKTADDEYTVVNPMGVTGSGTFEINGKSEDDKRSTIDFDGKTGFNLSGNTTTLKINDTNIKNIGASTNRGTLELNNVSFDFSSKNGTIGNYGTITGDNLTFENNNASNGVINNYNSSAKINNLNATFKNNKSTNGGAIYNTGYITNLNADFINNYATSNGGAIYLSSSYTNDIRNSNFEGNYAGSYGGAVYSNSDTSTFTNTNFIDNHASQGGAIYTGSTYTTGLNIVADNGTSEFKGNWQGSESNKVSNAIYAGNALAIINLTAKNNGVINFEDAIDGIKGYTLNVTGDGTGVVKFYNDVNNAVLNTSKVTIDLADGEIRNYNLYKVVSDKTTNWQIDIDLTKKIADTITPSSLQSEGVVTIDKLNILDGSFDDITQESLPYVIQILKVGNNKIQLALSDDVQASMGDREFSLGETTAHLTEETGKDTNWNDTVRKYDQTADTYGKIGLATKDTTNDSIGVAVSRYEVKGEKTYTGTVDTLMSVNQSKLEERNFNFDSGEDKYTTKSNLGETAGGKLTVNGKTSEGSLSTVNLSSYTGFELKNETELTFNNTNLTGNNEQVITVENEDAVVNLNNSRLGGNIKSDVKYNLNINTQSTDVTTLNGKVANSNTTLNAGSLKFNAGAFTGATLNTKSGSVLDFGGGITQYTIGTLNAENGTLIENLTVDMNTGVSDKIVVTNSSGEITINSINVKPFMLKPYNTPGSTVSWSTPSSRNSYEVISKSGIVLTLSEDVKNSEYLTEETINEIVTSDSIKKDTNWKDIYYDYGTVQKTYSTVSITNDIILNFSTKRTETIEEGQVQQGDTLRLVAQSDLAERNFNFDSANDEYLITEPLDGRLGVNGSPFYTHNTSTGAGVLNINGVTLNGQNSTINLNNMNGFYVAEATEMNIKDVNIVNGYSYYGFWNNRRNAYERTAIAIALNNADAKISLDNVTFAGNYTYDISANNLNNGIVSVLEGTVTKLNANFINNRGLYAGAIYIGKNGLIDCDIAGNFINNNNMSYGQPFTSSSITNLGVINGNIRGNFIDNKNYDYNYQTLGTIVNTQGGQIKGSITGNFIGNYNYNPSYYSAGVINNYSNSIIEGGISGVFTNNTGWASGAINNYNSTIGGSISGDFTGNYAMYYNDTSAGAIRNYGNSSTPALINGDIKGNFINNRVNSGGYYSGAGAIANSYYATINGSIEGYFEGNYDANNMSSGAIGNYSNSTIKGHISGNFINNTGGSAGAILNNYGVIGETGNTGYAISGNFNGNKSTYTSGYYGAGAIYNYGSTAVINGDIGGYFEDNTSTTGAGAISFQDGAKLNGSIRGSFVGNYGGNAGAILFCGGTVNGDIIADFTNNSAGTSNMGAAGAISLSYYSGGTINGSIKGNFIGNTGGLAGAIFNSGTITGDIEGNFINNTQTTGNPCTAGAIANYNTIKGAIKGTFVNNEGIGMGGAITNYNGGTIGAINSSFYNNHTTGTGGAIYNNYGTISSGEISNIAQNYVSKASGEACGGAIRNMGTFNANINNGTTGYVAANYAETGNGAVQGGAIWNIGTFGSTTGTSLIRSLTQNYVKTGSGNAQGGAIWNVGTFNTSTIGQISDNYAYTESGNAQGGAIWIRYQGGYFNSKLTGNVTGNRAESKNGTAQGGAIYMANSSKITIGDNITFAVNKSISTNNNTSNGGGAVYVDTNNSWSTFHTGKNNSFQSNEAIDGNGGAIATNTTGSSIHLGENNTFSGNYAHSLKDENGEFVKDSSGNLINGNGGAIAACTLLAEDGTNGKYSAIFQGNYADNMGGAIYNSNSQGGYLKNAVIYGNYANKGGGAAVYVLTLDNGVLSNNVATQDGGGYYIIGRNGPYGSAIIDTDVTNNHAINGHGGGIYLNSGMFYVGAVEKNVTFGGNTDSTGYNDIYDGQTSNTYSMIFNAYGDKTITFNGTITGDSNYSAKEIVINQNKDSYAKPTVSGDYVYPNASSFDGSKLNGTVTFKNTVNEHYMSIWGGTAKFDHSGSGSVTVDDDGNYVVDILTSNNSGEKYTGSYSYANVWNGTLDIDSSVFADNKKGVVVIYSPSIYVKNSLFANNTNTSVFRVYGSSTRTTDIHDNIFINNSSDNNGGVFYYSNTSWSLDEIGENNLFHNNTAKNGKGGAIYIAPATLYIGKNNTFSNNQALGDDNSDGGAIYYSSRNDLPEIIDEGNIFDSNHADGHGGAIATSNISVEIHDATFTNNTAKYGGALSGGFYTIYNSTIDGNSATADGGAIYAAAPSSITPSNFLINTNLTNNHSDGLGGAVYIGSSSNYLSIWAKDTDVLISGNTDSTGSNAIYNNGSQVFLLAAEDKTITINDKISGSGSIYVGMYRPGYWNHNKDDLKINNVSPDKNLTAKGTVIFNDDVSATTIFALGGKAINNATLNGNIVIQNLYGSDYLSELISNADGLNGTVSLQGSGTLTLTGGTLTQNVTGGLGTVNINGDVTANSNIAASNKLSLNEGTFTIDSKNGGSYSVTGNDTISHLVANGGALSLKDDAVTNFSLYQITLNDDLRVSIDTNFETKESDTITLNNVVNENNKHILLSDINVLSDIIDYDAMPAGIQVALGNPNTYSLYKLASDVVINSDNLKDNYIITYENSGANAGKLMLSYGNLKTAIDNNSTNKAYNMTDDETLEEAHNLVGESLSVTGNGAKITGNGNDGVTVKDDQTLSLNNVSELSGFDTAIKTDSGDGTTAGGTININGVTLKGNNVDVENNGVLNFNNENSVQDKVTGTGDTNVKTGTTTIETGASLEQKTVTVDDGAKLVNNSQVKADVTNSGTLNNSENATITGNLTNNSGTATNDGTITGNVENKNGANFTNSGTVGGNLENSGSAVNSGKISGDVNNNEGASLNNTGLISGALVNNGDLVNNGIISGTTVNTENHTILNNDEIINNITNQGTVNNVGVISGDINNSGTVNSTLNGLTGNVSNNDNAVVNYVGSGATNNDISGSGKVNFNAGSGAVVLNNNMDNNTVAINSGVLVFGNNKSVTGFEGNGGAINSANGKNETVNLGKVTLNEKTNLVIDFNLDKLTSDKFSATEITGDGKFNIANVRLTGKTFRNNAKVHLGDTTTLGKDNVTSNKINLGSVMTPIRKINAQIENGWLTFAPAGNKYKDFNPAVVVAPVAAQLGGYFSQLQSYDEAFNNLDMKMLMTREERMALKFANKYSIANQEISVKAPEMRLSAMNTSLDREVAALDFSKKNSRDAGEMTLLAAANNTETPIVYSPTIYPPEQDKSLWFRPYATFERVNMKNGPHVSNILYGSYFGGESQMYELKRGWDFQYSAYVGYNGSHQAYQGNDIYQNGGTFGVTGMWFKGNFFTALTANVGASVAEGSTMYGSEDFPMLMSGVASKTGYNFEFARGRFIIQPSYLMSYTFVNTFDYTNAAGARINSDPLHAINIAPGLKFIENLKNGWQPYLSVKMVWNIMDKTDFMAANTALPDMSIKPYIEYGLGLQRRWGDRFTGYVQAMIRNGGRNGVALGLGLRWAIGR